MSAREVWKFPLTASESIVDMPVGARVLTVQVQDGTPCIWAIVAPEQPTEVRRFFAEGTGWGCDDSIERAPYIGTVQVGPLVWHIFERVIER